MSNLQEKLEKMEAHTGPCFAKDCELMHLTPKTTDLILSLFTHLIEEEAKGMESHINYHIENGIEYLDQNDVGISMQWEKGHNYALEKLSKRLIEAVKGKEVVWKK